MPVWHSPDITAEKKYVRHGESLHLFLHSEVLFSPCLEKLSSHLSKGKNTGVQPKFPLSLFKPKNQVVDYSKKRKVYKMFKIMLKHSDARLFYNLPHMKNCSRWQASTMCIFDWKYPVTSSQIRIPVSTILPSWFLKRTNSFIPIKISCDRYFVKEPLQTPSANSYRFQPYHFHG